MVTKVDAIAMRPYLRLAFDGGHDDGGNGSGHSVMRYVFGFHFISAHHRIFVWTKSGGGPTREEEAQAQT